MSHEPLLLPRVSRATVDIANRLYAGFPSLEFVSAGTQWRLAPGVSRQPKTWRARAYVTIGDHAYALFFDSLILADWEGSGLDMHTLSALPSELAAAALELVCRDAAEAVELAAGLPVAVTGLNMREEEAWLPDDAVQFALTRSDGQTVRGAVAAEPDALALLADLFTGRATRPEPECVNLPVRCRLLLDGPELDRREFSDLEAGDILLTNFTSRDTDEAGLPVRLCVTHSYGASARLKGASLIVEGLMTQETPVAPVDERQDEDAAEPQESAPLEAASSADIPLTVSFDLGGVELSVADIASLAPGMILHTGRELESPVRLTVSGRSVGSGSLVDVAGRIGVRIETLSVK